LWFVKKVPDGEIQLRHWVKTLHAVRRFLAVFKGIFISLATLRSTMLFTFWFFICAATIMFLHNKILLTDKETDIKNESYKHIFNTLENYGTLKIFNQMVGQARINTQQEEIFFWDSSDLFFMICDSLTIDHLLPPVENLLSSFSLLLCSS